MYAKHTAEMTHTRQKQDLLQLIERGHNKIGE
jgi:hypothetical protein